MVVIRFAPGLVGTATQNIEVDCSPMSARTFFNMIKPLTYSCSIVVAAIVTVAFAVRLAFTNFERRYILSKMYRLPLGDFGRGPSSSMVMNPAYLFEKATSFVVFQLPGTYIQVSIPFGSVHVIYHMRPVLMKA